MQDLPLLGRVGYVLELAVTHNLELPELLDQVINWLFLIVPKLIGDDHHAPAVLPTIDLC